MVDVETITPEALKRMHWSQLQRVALDVGVPLREVREARALDDLRRAVLVAAQEKSR